MLPTERFSSRVQDYVKYRPSYPAAIVTTLTDAHILTPDTYIADIGSGTGLLARLFLEAGHTIYGIEPNDEMRTAGKAFLQPINRLRTNDPAGEAFLVPYERFFTGIKGTAEATTLAPQSVELITAGQAFHWFDRPRAKAEFRRILRGGRWVALIWNERLVHASPFLEAYENLLKEFSTDYTKIDHRQITPEILADFFDTPSTTHTFPNRQTFDFEGLQGRLLSSSYAPAAGHPRHDAMLKTLRNIFETHQVSGKVNFEYETRMYTGQLA